MGRLDSERREDGRRGYKLFLTFLWLGFPIGTFAFSDTKTYWVPFACWTSSQQPGLTSWKQMTHRTKRMCVNSTFIADSKNQHFNFFCKVLASICYLVFFLHNKVQSRQESPCVPLLTSLRMVPGHPQGTQLQGPDFTDAQVKRAWENSLRIPEAFEKSSLTGCCLVFEVV